MRRTLACAAGLAALAGLAAPAVSAGSANVLAAFRKQLPLVKQKTSVPVLLPASLPFAGKVPRLYASSGAATRSWTLTLEGAPGCGGANACFLASFSGKRGGKLPRTANLRLAGGQPAAFKDVSCGASCSPATLWFVHRGVLYTWQHKDAPPKSTKALFARLAAEAIAAGPR